MRYIGSKERLLGNIESVLKENGAKCEVFADLFAGTASVARHFKKKGYQIISNDLLYFSYLIQRKYIETNETPEFEKLKMSCAEVIDYLNNSEIYADDEFVLKNFSPFGDAERKYLIPENARKIDSILHTIEIWNAKKLTNDIEDAVLRATTVEAVPFVSNISGTYGAYLKEYDRRAFKELTLKVPEFISNQKQNYVFNTDANKLVREIECDILYLDPPYNTRDYISNYHLLETIARNDRIELKGKTGLRKDDHLYKSSYCRKTEAVEALTDLINNAKAKYILMSYSSEGIIEDKTIEKIFKSKGTNYRKTIISFNRFKSNSNGEQPREVFEYIYFVKSA
jgi:adenine-specific DNA-methyltransferase